MGLASRLQLMLCAPAVIALAAVYGCDPYAPTVGHMELVITGLPDSIWPEININGPSYNELLSQTSAGANFVFELKPGRYTITAAPVATNETRWTATPAVQTVSVRADHGGTTVSIAYAPATSRLALEVIGIPTGAAAITISGPGGFMRTATGSQALDLLAPGTYTIVAPDVASGGNTRRASPASGSITLAPSVTARTYTVSYGSVPGDLAIDVSGIPVGAVASVTITGPAGFTREVAAPTTMTDLTPGTYTVTARVASSGAGTVIHSPSPRSQSVTVTSTAPASASIAYTVLQLGLDVVLSNLVNPIFLTAPEGDQRLFIIERAGRIRIMRGGQLLATPFLDITSRVRADLDRGLLSMAFDPSYATNGFFYVYFTNPDGDITVERYAAEAGADIASPLATPVIMITQRNPSENNGGLVMFGPDGMLYLAMGDGSGNGDATGNSQNPATLLGKMLRIDVRTLPYTIPPTNPFVGQAGKRPEIWALGLRNARRFDFDTPPGASTSNLVIPDRGANINGEINVASIADAGINYGWNVMDGSQCFLAPGCNQTGLTRPVMEDLPSGCSITGGFVYRGSAIPELAGHFFFSDVCQGWLASMNGDRASGFVSRLWSVPRVSGVFSFGEDASGELYMISHEGSIYRIVRR